MGHDKGLPALHPPATLKLGGFEANGIDYVSTYARGTRDRPALQLLWPRRGLASSID